MGASYGLAFRRLGALFGVASWQYLVYLPVGFLLLFAPTAVLHPYDLKTWQWVVMCVSGVCAPWCVYLSVSWAFGLSAAALEKGDYRGIDPSRLASWGFVGQLGVRQGMDTRNALSRSGALTKGSRWLVAGAVLALWLLPYLIEHTAGWAIGVPVGHALDAVGASHPVADMVSSLCVLAVALPIAPIMPLVLTLMYFDARFRKDSYDPEAIAQDIGLAEPSQTTRD